jgi:hypothetical protein
MRAMQARTAAKVAGMAWDALGVRIERKGCAARRDWTCLFVLLSAIAAN